MQITTLGHSGLRIPRIGMGCANVGKSLTQPEATNIIATAIDLGLTFFDTADIYANGESERIVGKAIKGKRDQCIVGTKFRHFARQPGASRKSITVSLENSLKRLGVDYIDLYQLHAPDPSSPIEETITTLQNLVQQGKILYFGLCNAQAWQVVDAQHVARSVNGMPLVSVQRQVNAVDYSGFNELRQVSQLFDVAVLAASPLARGLLGCQYDQTHPPASDHPLLSSKGIGYWHKKGFETVNRLRQVAEQLDCSPSQLALQVLFSFPEIAGALVGFSSKKQVIECSQLKFDKLEQSTVHYILGIHNER